MAALLSDWGPSALWLITGILIGVVLKRRFARPRWNLEAPPLPRPISEEWERQCEEHTEWSKGSAALIAPGADVADEYDARRIS